MNVLEYSTINFICRFLALVCILREDNFEKKGQFIGVFNYQWVKKK